MFYIFCFLLILFSIIFSKFFIKSSFEGINSDQYKQIKSINNYKDWFPWTSKIHSNNDKAAMKDVGILCAFFVNFFFKNKFTINPIVVTAFIGHLLSSFLLYLIVAHFFSEKISFLISVLYFFSIWPYVIIFHAGYQTIAQMFFLLSVYLLIKSFSEYYLISFLTIFLSGVTFVFMNFTSASARKFILPFLIFFIFKFYSYDSFFVMDSIVLASFKYINILILFIFIINILLLINFKIITKFKFFNLNKSKYFKESYFKIFKNISLPFFCLIILICLNIFYVKNSIEIYHFLFFLLGILTSLFYFLYPDFKHSLEIYYRYLIIENDWGSHWKLYDKFYKKKINNKVTKNYKSILLNFKIFFLMLPDLFFVYLLSFISMFIFFYLNLATHNEIILFMICYFMPLSGILWSEITGGPRATLPYYTVFVTFFAPIAFYLEFLINNFIFLNYYIYILILFLLLRNLYILFYDVIPSRIHNHLIYQFLIKNKIFEIYTYDNLYNTSFEKMINFENPNKINFKYVNSVKEIKNGYFFQPCVSPKTSYHQSSGEGVKESLYFDNELKKLYLNNTINNFTLKKFKTRGTSKYWHIIGNIIALRLLIFKEIDEFDNDLSYARILKIDNIN